MERIAKTVGNLLRVEGESFQVEKTNIALKVQYMKPQDTTVIVNDGQDNTASITFTNKSLISSSSVHHRLEVKAQIPKEAFLNENQYIYSVFYRNSTLFQSPTESLQKSLEDIIKQVVSSNVMDISVGNLSISKLQNPVILMFEKFQNTNQRNGDDICSFWNFNLRKCISLWLQ